MFKIATYDGLCNCTKIYINDKLRSIADPFDIGQYVWQPFVDVADNFYESITLGGSMHTKRNPTIERVSSPTEISAGIGGVGGVAPARRRCRTCDLSKMELPRWASWRRIQQIRASTGIRRRYFFRGRGISSARVCGSTTVDERHQVSQHVRERRLQTARKKVSNRSRGAL